MKYMTWQEAKAKVDAYRSQGKVVVFTNGVFDLIHPGHIKLLREARKQGDVLVLALNSDASVRRLKGEKRPILTLEERISILQAIVYVDIIVSFDEDTPYKLIDYLKPNVLVKGGDYLPEEVVGAELVDRVFIVELERGISTSGIIERIIGRYC